jgi:hypothetical protein
MTNLSSIVNNIIEAITPSVVRTAFFLSQFDHMNDGHQVEASLRIESCLLEKGNPSRDDHFVV